MPSLLSFTFHGLQEAREYAEAIRIEEDLLARQLRDADPEDEDTLNVMMQLAFTTKKARQLERSEELFRQVREIRSRLFGPDDPTALVAGNQLSVVLRFQNRIDAAEEVCREVLERRIRVFGDISSETVESLCDMSNVCEADGRIAEATEYTHTANSAAGEKSAAMLIPTHLDASVSLTLW